MRFRYPDARDQVEQRARERLLAKMDSWWKAFTDSAETIDRRFSRKAEFDIPAFMHQHLGAVDPRLSWEFGPGVRGGKHRLVITPEAGRHLRPMVDVLLRRAPRLEAWEFYPYRLAENLQQAELTVQGRTQGSIEGWRVCISENEAQGVDLTYWAPSCAGPDDEAARSVAFVATETLLGEEILDKFIDGIEVASSPVAGAKDVALDELREQVDLALRRQRELLPDRPLLDSFDDAKWTLMKLEPADAPDYEHQLDLFVAKTSQMPMWQRAHSSLPFVSARFSRCGETFCFIKTDGSQGLDPTGFADKAEIEDALEAALGRDRLGAVIGGGTGRRYSYVDLALVDVERAIPVIQAALRGGKIAKRTWLQFFDSELADEWVGIWDDTPAPPGFEPTPE